MSYFSAFQKKILGLAREFDFVIKLTLPSIYERFKKQDPSILPLYIHEWTHYIQLLSTSLGNLIAETERLIHFTKLALILSVSKACGSHLDLPIDDMLSNNPRIAKNEDVSINLVNLSDLIRRREILCRSWLDLLTDAEFNLADLKRTRPFKLDETNGALWYTPPNGEAILLPITGVQLLEHSAKSAELILKQGIIELTELTTPMFDYYGFFLYLVQEGVMELHPVGPNRLRVGLTIDREPAVQTLGATISMFVSCQLSQMLYAGVGQMEKEAPVDATDRDFDSYFALERMRSSATVFCLFLRSFKSVSRILDEGTLSTEKRLDKLCISFGIPSYHTMVRHQLRRAQRALDSISQTGSNNDDSKWDEELRSLLSRIHGTSPDELRKHKADFSKIYSDLFLRASVVVLKALLLNPDASINPVMHSEGLPIPWVVIEAPDGARRLAFRTFFQKDCPFIDVPKSVMSYFQEEDMLTNKALFDKNFACYMDGLDKEGARVTRASLGCTHFSRCYQTQKDSVLGFCKQKDWMRIASTTLESWKALGRLWH